MCTATRTSSYSPVGPSVIFVYLAWAVLCVSICAFLFMCPHSFMFPWAVESSPLQFLALAQLISMSLLELYWAFTRYDRRTDRSV